MNAPATTSPSPEKAWATLQARAALAGHTAARDPAGWVTLSCWGRTISFEDVGTAAAWLDRALIGGAA